MLLSVTTRYLKVPLVGLIYIISLPVIGAITIVPLMLYRAGLAVNHAVRGHFSEHL